MEVLLNRSLGAFNIPLEIYDDYEDLIDCNEDDPYFKVRTDLTLIEKFKNNRGMFSKNMVLFCIPDNWFYKISDYDGYESIFYSSSEIKEF